METYDIYCLLPHDADLAGVLTSLFDFEGGAYVDGDHDMRINAGPEAAAVFLTRMTAGSFVRFDRAWLPETAGGWLYRLDDGAAVVGLSGSADQPGVALAHLRRLVPDGKSFVYGDQPPPPDSEGCLRAWRSQE